MGNRDGWGGRCCCDAHFDRPASQRTRDAWRRAAGGHHLQRRSVAPLAEPSEDGTPNPIPTAVIRQNCTSVRVAPVALFPYAWDCPRVKGPWGRHRCRLAIKIANEPQRGGIVPSHTAPANRYQISCPIPLQGKAAENCRTSSARLARRGLRLGLGLRARGGHPEFRSRHRLLNTDYRSQCTDSVRSPPRSQAVSPLRSATALSESPVSHPRTPNLDRRQSSRQRWAMGMRRPTPKALVVTLRPGAA